MLLTEDSNFPIFDICSNMMLMKINEKIRMMRELNNWTQEDMADKLHMSLNSYAKLERGESKVYVEKLEQVAEIFNIDVIDLLSLNKQGLVGLFIGDNSNNNHQVNYYGQTDATAFEIEKLNLVIEHKNELLKQKDLIIEQQEKQIQLLTQINSQSFIDK